MQFSSIKLFFLASLFSTMITVYKGLVDLMNNFLSEIIILFGERKNGGKEEE